MSNKQILDGKTQIEVTADDTTMIFAVDDHDYKKFINASSGAEKTAPMHNFCMATVVEADKDKLKAIFKKFGVSAYPLIAGEILDAYQPTLNVVAKKLSPGQSN